MGNKPFSENFLFLFCFFFFFGPIKSKAQSLPAPTGSPPCCEHPCRPLHTGGTPLASPQIPGHTSQQQLQPNPRNTDITTPAHAPAKPPSDSHFISFLPLSLVLNKRRSQARLPRAPRARTRTNYTGCGFQFYIVWPFLALITLIN